MIGMILRDKIAKVVGRVLDRASSAIQHPKNKEEVVASKIQEVFRNEAKELVREQSRAEKRRRKI